MKHPLSVAILSLLTACGSGVPGPAPGGGDQERPPGNDQQPGADDQHPSGDDQGPGGNPTGTINCNICHNLVACEVDLYDCLAWCNQVSSLGTACESLLTAWLNCVSAHVGPDLCKRVQDAVDGHVEAPQSDDDVAKMCDPEQHAAKPCLPKDDKDAGEDDPDGGNG